MERTERELMQIKGIENNVSIPKDPMLEDYLAERRKILTEHEDLLKELGKNYTNSLPVADAESNFASPEEESRKIADAEKGRLEWIDTLGKKKKELEKDGTKPELRPYERDFASALEVIEDMEKALNNDMQKKGATMDDFADAYLPVYEKVTRKIEKIKEEKGVIL